MASYCKFLVALSCLLNLHTLVVKSTNPDFETYIVHVEPPPSTSALNGESPSDDLQGWYQTFMPSSDEEGEEPRILYSYHNVFKGFAARLSPEQAKAMETKPGFISAQPQKKFSLHTTHSPNFLGLNRNAGSFWSNSNYGRGVIIGVLDTGVNPLHPSFFDDEGMPPPPARWRGACQLSPPLRCNNKLIGARSFTIGNGTPLDEDGHGTHTASTAAGSFVRGASVFGNANGTAAGTAPLAHVATYKVCLPTECSEIDIVAAIDAAIDDGVDVLSLSLGVQHADFYSDNVAVGTFSAFERGIFVSASAGNSGPRPVTIENGAPWILTVGASSVCGRGVIIGLLDSGVNPLHPSFSDDEGMPPPPARWKGICQLSSPARCNNKLIGARHFTIGNGNPLDEDGHGTHTASTAAGNFVRGANLFGNANGTAAGIAPLAHVATYKVCLPLPIGCPESDTVAALDAAIDDGVDVLSLSIGEPHSNFYSDNVAVGTFSAFERGIFVSASAGNSGPFLRTIENGAPWILTVGASSVDRKIRATAVLGNGERLDGESTFQPPDFSSTPLPLVYPGAVNPSASLCAPESLANADVLGKIVVCDYSGDVGQAVKDAGGAGMILVNQPNEGYTTTFESYVLPATLLSYVDGVRVKAYLNTTSSSPHTAGISFGGTLIGDTRAPEVSSFSARGPNPGSIGILKPDIIGPGQNILAAWHVSVEGKTGGTNSNFNIISGTSMSCPHLSGVAALLKSAHPNWSPSAIKSAMMTTADQVNLAGNPIVDQTLGPASVLATGSGHINVLRATNPGLVYDIRPEEYLPYLCGLGYSDAQVGIIVNHRVRCLEIGSISDTELNYPSFSVALGYETQTYSRTVTNVGEADSVYTVETAGLLGVDLRVEPTTLRFSGVGQNLTYRVSFTLSSSSSNASREGSLTWSSAAPNSYSVRSPISVLFLV